MNSQLSSSILWRRRGAPLLAALLGVAAPAVAEEPQQPGPALYWGLSAGFSSMDLNNSHFGRGLIWPLPTPQIPLASYKADVARSEYYAAPKAGFTWNLQNQGTVFGEVRAVASRTVGDGDTWNLTAGDPSYSNIDSLYLGWRSAATAKYKWEVSVGSQNFVLGDGMVLMDGDNESSRKGLYWSDARQAWKQAVLVKFDTAPIHVELFSLQCDHNFYPDANGNAIGGNLGDNILGANFELRSARKGLVGVSYFHINQSDLPTRVGMSVANVHARVRPFDTQPTLELAGEYDAEHNGNLVDAKAWFAEAKYTVLMPYYPTLGYRYSVFSGAKSPTDNQGWDSLHNGATSQGFGYWYQGIVVGTYETLLSNLDTHFVNLTVAPPGLPGSWVKLLFYDFLFDQKDTGGLFPVSGAPVSSSKFATEWDLMLGYSPRKTYDVMFIFGRATPGQGGIERNQGFDKPETMVQFTVFFHF